MTGYYDTGFSRKLRPRLCMSISVTVTVECYVLSDSALGCTLRRHGQQYAEQISALGDDFPSAEHAWPWTIHAETCLARGLCNSHRLQSILDLRFEYTPKKPPNSLQGANTILAGTPPRGIHHSVTPNFSHRSFSITTLSTSQ